jgi:hypothetical protein
MSSTLDYQAPGAQATALASAAEAGAAILHDVAANAAEVGATDAARAGASSVHAAAEPARDKVHQAVSAAAGAGRDLIALIRQFPLVSVVAGLGIGFKIAQRLYRRPAQKAVMPAQQALPQATIRR